MRQNAERGSITIKIRAGSDVDDALWFNSNNNVRLSDSTCTYEGIAPSGALKTRRFNIINIRDEQTVSPLANEKIYLLDKNFDIWCNIFIIIMTSMRPIQPQFGIPLVLKCLS